MHTWLLIAVITAAAIAGISLLLLLRRLLSPPESSAIPDLKNSEIERAESLQIGIAKLHNISIHHQIDVESKKKMNFGLEVSLRKPLFSWSDHPDLVTDAVEHGWSRFAFTTPYTSSRSARSSRTPALLGPCGGVAEEKETGVEISWEVSPGSADFMQKIRINSGFKRGNSISVIKTALPLPGPPLGNNSSFPQEAYFEIAVLRVGTDGEGQFGDSRVRSESENAKLIQQTSIGNGDSESIVHDISSVHRNNNKSEGLKFGGISVSIGLVRGGPLPLKAPGSYPGSVGFNSDGSVYLDGIKLVLDSQKHEWGRPERVIGCGYNPTQKRVFFTVDSQLVHMISCKTEEFGTPLYPILAANSDVAVLVNFGQSTFKYLAANSQRTSNPCFIGPLAHSPTLGYEDSRELFSMGILDSQLFNRSTARNSIGNYAGNNKCGTDFDEESEGDLFDIMLDCNVKSPNTVLE